MEIRGSAAVNPLGPVDRFRSAADDEGFVRLQWYENVTVEKMLERENMYRGAGGN